MIEKLKKYKQEHLLKFYEEISDEKKLAIEEQIKEIDFSYLDALGKEENQKGVITPIKAMTISEINENKDKFEKIGLEALKNQEVGALLLAGGMGTRLGSDNPKGMYNIGKTKDVYIFQRLIENLLDVVDKCGKPIPFFIMTSEKNHEATVNFLDEHNYFGYDKNYVRFFVQEMAPCIDLNGKVLLEEKGRVATSPNGNGGWFNSLLKNKEAKEMLEKFNLKWLNIFAVDNVLQKIADPVFVGATSAPHFYVGSASSKEEGVGLLGMTKRTYYTVSTSQLCDDLNAAATFATAEVGTDIAVTITALELVGTHAENYNLTNTEIATTASSAVTMPKSP